MNHIKGGVFISTAKQAEALVQNNIIGIQAIVNVGRLSTYSIPKNSTIEYNKISLRQSNKSENVHTLIAAYNLVEYYVRKNMLVLVHCKAGYARSPMVVCLYLMVKHDMTYKQANRIIKYHHRMRDGYQEVIKKAYKLITNGIRE